MSFEEALDLLGQDATIALYGTYSDVGVRMWFHRRRSALDGFTPYEILMTTKYEILSISANLTLNGVDIVQQLALELNNGMIAT